MNIGWFSYEVDRILGHQLRFDETNTAFMEHTCDHEVCVVHGTVAFTVLRFTLALLLFSVPVLCLLNQINRETPGLGLLAEFVEDDLHLDLRTLSFRFVFAPPGPPKPAEMLKSYAENGSGTVQGLKDRDKEIQIEFWQRAAKEGFTDERARASAQKFRTEFDAMDKRLSTSPYLMGDAISVLDIAWFIYTFRLSLAGYPFERLHPHVWAWQEKLRARPEFAKEIAGTRKPATPVARTLEQVAGF